MWQTIQQRFSSSLFCRGPLWAVLTWAGMSTLWCCPSSISSAEYGIAYPPRCPDQRMVWCVTCPNHESFCLLTVARRASYGPKRKLILLHIQSFVLCSDVAWRSVSRTPGWLQTTSVASTQRFKYLDRGLKQSQASGTWAQLWLMKVPSLRYSPG